MLSSIHRRQFGAAAAVALALFTVAAGCLSERGGTEGKSDCTYYGGGPAATFFYPVASAPVEQPYGLRVAAVRPRTESDVFTSVWSFACDMTGDGLNDIISYRGTHSGGWGRYVVTAWNPTTSARAADLFEGLLVCFMERQGHGPHLAATMETDFEYVPAHAESSSATGRIFVHNLSGEAMSGFDESLVRAAREASAGNVLRCDNRLVLRTPRGERLSSTELPYSWKVGTGWPLCRDAVLVSLTNGHRNSELNYLTVERARHMSGVVDIRKSRTTPYGSLRGLASVDLGRSALSWIRRMGAPTTNALAFDLDGDARQEIVTGTHSPMNGISGGGTTDYGCGYVLCLDESGNELWRYRSAGPYLDYQVARGDVNGDGSEEIVTCMGEVTSTHHGELLVISADGEPLARNTAFEGMSGLVLADITGDGTAEIISGGSGGRLAAFDGDLTVVASFTDTAHQDRVEKRTIPLFANDLDGDGEIEIVAFSNGWTLLDWNPEVQKAGYDWSRQVYVVVLDSRLREEARLALPPIAGASPRMRGGGNTNNNIATDLNGDGINEIVLMVNSGMYVIEIVPTGADSAEGA